MSDYTVRDIIRSKLRKLKCDGLANCHVSCGCGINDLVPCGGDCTDCVPARSTVTRDGIEWHAVGFQKKEHKP